MEGSNHISIHSQKKNVGDDRDGTVVVLGRMRGETYHALDRTNQGEGGGGRGWR